MMLEFSQYLENYLWLNYNPESSSASHVLSIVIMVNEKFRERVSAWQVCVCLIIQIFIEQKTIL
jgi:intron-binding protein aquarius